MSDPAGLVPAGGQRDTENSRGKRGSLTCSLTVVFLAVLLHVDLHLALGCLAVGLTV